MRKRILLADDDAALRRLIRTTFADSGFELVEASTGTEALQIAADGGAALVLLDINMPELDGLEVCRRLKASEATRDIKVVILTARSAEIDRLAGQRAGADDYFVKPFSPVQLLNKVHALLG